MTVFLDSSTQVVLLPADVQGQSLLFAIINSAPIIPLSAMDGYLDLIQRIIRRGPDLNFLSQEVSCVRNLPRPMFIPENCDS